MRIAIDGTEYLVEFYYEGRCSNCFVNDLTNGKLYWGTAVRSKNDKPEKEKARKVTLKRALEKMSPNDKEFRSAFWTEFHRRRNKNHYLKRAGVTS